MSRYAAMLTRQEGCFYSKGKPLVSVNSGMPATDALEHASCMLDVGACLAMNIGEDGIRGSEAFAIQYLAEMAKALVDASAMGDMQIEVAND